MKYFSIFLFIILLKTSIVFSHSEYEDAGKHYAKKQMLMDLLDKIEFIESEISFMEKYNLKSEKYYFYKGANDFHIKCYTIILDEWEYF